MAAADMLDRGQRRKEWDLTPAELEVLHTARAYRETERWVDDLLAHGAPLCEINAAIEVADHTRAGLVRAARSLP